MSKFRLLIQAQSLCGSTLLSLNLRLILVDLRSHLYLNSVSNNDFKCRDFNQEEFKADDDASKYIVSSTVPSTDVILATKIRRTLGVASILSILSNFSDMKLGIVPVSNKALQALSTRLC